MTNTLTLAVIAAELQAGDLVLLDDGDRIVDIREAVQVGTDFRARVGIWWKDGGVSTWLADERCIVVRRPS